MHSLRSGRTYKDTMSDEGEHLGTATLRERTGATELQGETTSLAQMLQVLLEDRRKREEELLEERRLREEEMRRERALREEEMRQQMEVLRGLVEGIHRQGETAAVRAEKDKDRDVKIMKLTEEDDIEAYLTTFERLMRVHEVKEDRWAFRLAPHLSGKAQQAYAGMGTTEAGDYEKLKAAILKRYDITEESYRRRFRAARVKQGETNKELVTRLEDLINKWMQTCKTAEDVKDRVVLEQLLDTLPTSVRVFVKERKPTSSAEAAHLADDYITARKESDVGATQDKRQGVRCNRCKKIGHFARECRQGTTIEPEERSEASRPKQKRDLKEIVCFNCQQKGHYASNCPSKPSLFCQENALSEKKNNVFEGSLQRTGIVEGREVKNILLDTGCARTLIRQELVPHEKMIEGEAIPIRCAHGDTVLYPLALVKIVVGGCTIQIKAAVSETLPMDVLLGTDVPELKQLITEGTEPADALAVTTRGQARKHSQEDQAQELREQVAGATPTDLEEPQVEPWWQTFDDELFEGGRTKRNLTRSQKRQGRRSHWEDRNPTEEILEHPVGEDSSLPAHTLDISAEELKVLQSADPTLDAIRKAANGHPCSAGVGFFQRDGLLYRRWTPPGRGKEDMEIEQLVLPMQCRETVLTLAHDIPLAGHLGKDKTARRVLQRFYWPTLYRDVADHCRSCAVCQKSARVKPPRVPMIPLPIMTEPFTRIAMDIIGPLPRSRSGKKYVLVVCDYATRFPEAIPLKSIDAEHIAEELAVLFSRVGVPKEILTDQGSNFTSQLLMEIYRLLHVHPIRTTPYHPQTDGLVERFNQTLKSMLRKAAVEAGKDWDKLIPYLLFAYREVPQASTGFSPFELLYGRSVRGPLDILKESWEADKKSNESVVSYILTVREKMEKMTDLVKQNLEEAQKSQKYWYDRNARHREFQAGDLVLVLLPTSTSKLMAQWQGPYQVIRRVGKVDYRIKMHDRRQKYKVFHVNMLRKWHTPAEPVYYMDDPQGHSEDDLPVWEKDEGSRVEEVKVGSQLLGDQQEQLTHLLHEFSEIFQDKPGSTSMIEHHIHTGSAQSVRLPPYRVPYAFREPVKAELDEMVASGIIEPSTSEWCAPMVLVKKKDGSLRVCVDYRRLNQVSETDAYPMPRIDDLIDRVGSSTFISTMDLTRGYWQVPVAKEDRPKTAFATPYGLFQFNVMPFGLQGAPATFQRLMDRVIQGLDFAAAYLDDLVIFSSTWEEHLLHLRSILERLREAGLTAKAKKCVFGASECAYLGHIVGSGIVRPQQSKISAIESIGVPTTKKEVRTFLGITGYYRRFIENYSSIAAPLTDLTKKDTPHRIKWSQECDNAFKKLKGVLCSEPVLKSPNFGSPFVLQTDASDRGIGAVLSQHSEDGQEHPVAYWSRKLLPREQRYSTIEKECLAIKLGIEAFRVYLLGRPFTIETDHRSLVWMERLKTTNNRLARWSLALQPYNFKVSHRAGKENGNADALSRTATN